MYLTRLRALNFKKGLPRQPSIPSKPSFEGSEGDPGSGISKNQADQTCSQCGGGPATDPAYEAPTVRVKSGDGAEAWVHPGWCEQFWQKDRPQ